MRGRTTDAGRPTPPDRLPWSRRLAEQLEQLVPFLIYRVMARGSKRAAIEYAKLSLSIHEARILIALQPHVTTGIGQLAELTCLERSALSHILRRLSRRGLIRRRRLQHDGRSVEVALTAAGKRIALQCLMSSKAHEDQLLNDIGPKDRQVLRALITRMFKNTEGWDLDSDISSVATLIARSSGSGVVKMTPLHRAARTKS
jgi:MarR family transcriptional regulator, transcriptional regulator for hemolysin